MRQLDEYGWVGGGSPLVARAWKSPRLATSVQRHSLRAVGNRRSNDHTQTPSSSAAERDVFPGAVAAAEDYHHGNETDLHALMEFKSHIIDGPFNFLSWWNDSIHFCQWRGVTCGRQRHHQRVVFLDLANQKLAGIISPSVGNLSFLARLDLHNNSLTNEVPPELGRLQRLKYLWLYNNSIAGEIPVNISACSNLISFIVSFNKLVGKIPVELGSLLKAQVIDVSFNNLTGRFPPSFGNLSSLVKLNGAYNNLIGSIPTQLGKLIRLEFFALPVNMLSGIIPSTIFNLSSIKVFSLTTNKIQGTLPWDMGITLPILEFMAISDNQLTGTIPVCMTNMSKLRNLQAMDNDFTGQVPEFGKSEKLSWFEISGNHLGSTETNDMSFISSLTNSSDLEILALDNNNFQGTLPQSFSNLSKKLVGLWLGNNYISGNILEGIVNFLMLTRIQSSNNRFTGDIPTDIGKLQNLQVLQLSHNRFSGEIPFSLGNLTLLSILYLQDNNFSGSIASSLGGCSNLVAMNLSQNHLTGSIPEQVYGLSSLTYLDLSYNHLTGRLSIQVGNLKNLESLSVAENSLSNEIPSTLGNCMTLEGLYLQGNFFQGIVPYSLSYLKGILSLDLSCNNFSGKIPADLGKLLQLQYLNLSFNDFEGALPSSGIFKNTSVVSVTGNPELCGGIPEMGLPSCSSPRRNGLTRALKLIISLISALLGLSSLVVVFLFLYWSKRSKKEPRQDSTKDSLVKLSYSSLFQATDGFSPANLIGAGGHGSVYKGTLDNYGIVAVKVFNLAHHGASKSFLAECEALRNTRHRNLVKVLTACSGCDYQGNDFKALVYEFMVNGTLEEWLHPNPRDELAPTVSKKLNLLQRLNICIDVSHAMSYLHHDCETPIVHCDLKPSNVLLDGELVGHVGDFGLAKIFPSAVQNNNIFADQTSSSLVRGTIGYTAPEYGWGSEVSTYGDAYSFGILVLEMFTGTRPTDGMFTDGFTLRSFVEAALPDRVSEIVDPVLVQETEEEEEETNTKTAKDNSWMRSHEIQKCLISVFGVGISCAAESATERMDMIDAAARLTSIKNVLLRGTETHKGRKAH